MEIENKKRFIDRALVCGEIALWVGVVAYALIVTHDFFGKVDFSPIYAVDDVLANVSSFMSNYGRFGFPASPAVGGGGALYPRMEGLLTYGPWYFSIGAFLSWLVGFSLTLMRSLHLLLLMGMAGLTFAVFKRSGRFACALFALSVLFLFHESHWPMARPDIVVSFMACLFFVSAYHAVMKPGPVQWMLAAFFAASAAYSHLVAWAVVPACALVFAGDMIFRYYDSPSRKAYVKTTVTNLAGAVAGGLAGMFVYFYTIGFRFSDHFNMLLDYRGMVGKAHQFSYLDTLRRHYSYYTNNVPFAGNLVDVVAGACLLAVVLLFCTKWMRPDARRKVLATILPPLAVLGGYFLSLGTYKNYCLGYVILEHVASAWVIAATACVAVDLIAERFARYRKALLLMPTLFLIALGIILNVGIVKSGAAISHAHRAEQLGAQGVRISEYLTAVTEMIPPGSTAWGDVQFGLEAPNKVQLGQFGDMQVIINGLSLDQRRQYAPDYLIMGFLHNYIPVTPYEWNPLSRVRNYFPKERYTLQGLVTGKPYGEARIYSRNGESGADESHVPYVKVYDPALRQWGSRLGKPVAVEMKDVDPAEIYYESVDKTTPARQTVAAKPIPGWYLVKVGLRRDAGAEPKRMAVTVTASRKEYLPVNYFTAPFPSAPYFKEDNEAYVLYKHVLGEAYVSLFEEDSNAAITDVVFYPVAFFPTVTPLEVQDVSVPELPEWHMFDGVEGSFDDQGLHVTSNTEPLTYQVISPVIPVERGGKYRFSIDGFVNDGSISLNVLDDSGSFIYWSNILTDTHEFEVLRSDGIQIVVSNNNPQTQDKRSRFVISNPRLKRIMRKDDVLYSDQIVGSMKH